MRLLVLVGAVALAGCDYSSGPIPTNVEAERLDRAISEVPCVGKADLWLRQYQYRTTLRFLPASLWRLDQKTIDFHLTKVSDPADAGVHSEPPQPPFDWLADDTPTDLAWGSYNLASSRLQMDFCGSNVPSREAH